MLTCTFLPTCPRQPSVMQLHDDGLLGEEEEDLLQVGGATPVTLSVAYDVMDAPSPTPLLPPRSRYSPSSSCHPGHVIRVLFPTTSTRVRYATCLPSARHSFLPVAFAVLIPTCPMYMLADPVIALQVPGRVGIHRHSRPASLVRQAEPGLDFTLPMLRDKTVVRVFPTPIHLHPVRY